MYICTGNVDRPYSEHLFPIVRRVLAQVYEVGGVVAQVVSWIIIGWFAQRLHLFICGNAVAAKTLDQFRSAPQNRPLIIKRIPASCSSILSFITDAI